jgi:hypothetical protein
MTTDLVLDKTMVESADEGAITFIMDQILAKAHPVVAEALFLASTVHSYTLDKFNFLRPQNSEQNEKLLQRLAKFSFVIALEREGRPTQYNITELERDWLQLRWIAADPQAFRHAHHLALNFHQANPDPDDFAQRQHILYHQLVVDYAAARTLFADSFRAYINDRRFAAVERLIATAKEVRPFLVALQAPYLAEFDGWLSYVGLRFRQYRGEWQQTQDELVQLLAQPDTPADLVPFVQRAYGEGLERTGRYVEVEQGYTMFALGEAHVSLATSARGYREAIPLRAQTFWQRLRELLSYPPFPLLLYLSFYFGWWIWLPRSWAIFKGQDWIIARLFAVGANWYNQAESLYRKIQFQSGLQSVQEHLSNLYLTLGDAQRAEPILRNLLHKEDDPLSAYRQAAVQVSLGHALVRLQRDTEAIEQLEQAIPILQIYDDKETEARAHALVAEALFEVGQRTDGLERFDRSLRLYQKAGDVVAATEVAERVYLFGRDDRLTKKEREFAASTTSIMSRRQYLVRFEHPVLRAFRRAMYLTLSVVLFAIPAMVINLDTAVTLTPNINFFAFPFLEAQLSANTLNYGPSLSQAIVLVLKPSTDANVFGWIAAVALAIYFLLYTIFGLLAIIRTPLKAVQGATQAETIRFDLTGFTVGLEDAGRNVLWHEISRTTRANVFLLGQLVRDHSLMVVESPSRRVTIRGTAAWYESLTHQIERYAPAAAKKDNLSYHIGWGKLSFAYGFSVLLLLIFAILVKLAPHLLFTYIPFTPYSFADLYPLFYLGLFLGPVYWGVLRPLRIEVRAKARNNLPWIAFGLAGIFGLVRFFLYRRPLLTIPDIYPPLFIILLTWTAMQAILRAKSVTGKPTFALWPRRGVQAAAAIIILLMLIQGGRDVLSRHFYIMGNWHRDAGLKLSDADQEAEYWRAIENYERAIALNPPRMYSRLGLPSSRTFTWVQATNNRATLYAQLGDFAAATNDYATITRYLNPRYTAPYHASKAVAYVSWAAQLTDEDQTDKANERYGQAQDAFDAAIEQEPDHSDFYVWRGVADHNILGDLDAAAENYSLALVQDPDHVDALLGLGWVSYQEAENLRQEIAAAPADTPERASLATEARLKYQAALQYFTQAAIRDPQQANIQLAIGYAHYALQEYPAALHAWEFAADLAPDDPVMIVSRGTGYWRVGTLPACSNSQATEEEKALSAQYLNLALEDLNLALTLNPTDAFTYRTRAQIEFILSNCTSQGYDTITQLRQSVESYAQAVNLEPENDLYLIFRGRIGYLLARALFLAGPQNDTEARTVLDQVISDIKAAYTIDPTDDPVKQNKTWYDFVVGPTGDAAWPDFHRRRGQAALTAGDYAQAYSDLSYATPLITDNLELAFQAGLAALAEGEVNDAAAFYDTAIERMALAQDANNLTPALEALSSLVQSRPDLNLSNFATQFQNAPALQENPDLQDNDSYWHYRARFGFTIVRRLFEAGQEDEARTALAGVVVDIEKAYALAPTANRNDVWRQFYSEGAWGWLYLRRADGWLENDQVAEARTDYELATSLIPSDNEVTAADYAEAKQQLNRTTFMLALQMLQENKLEQAATLYDQGVALAQEREDEAVVNEAIADLQAALIETPQLSAAAQPFLVQLQTAFSPPGSTPDNEANDA